MRGNLFLKIIPLIFLLFGGLAYAQSSDPKPSPSQIKQTQSKAELLRRQAWAIERIVKSLKEFSQDNDPQKIVSKATESSLFGTFGGGDAYKQAQKSHEKAEAALDKLEILAADINDYAERAYRSAGTGYVYAEGVVVDKGGTNQLHYAEQTLKEAYARLHTYERESGDAYTLTNSALGVSAANQELAVGVVSSVPIGRVGGLAVIISSYISESRNSPENAGRNLAVRFGTYLAFRGLKLDEVLKNTYKYIDALELGITEGTSKLVEEIIDNVKARKELEGKEGNIEDLKGAIAYVPGQGPVSDAWTRPENIAPDASSAVSSTSDQFKPENIAPDASSAVSSTSGAISSAMDAISSQFAFGGMGPSYYGGGPSSQAPGPPGTGWIRIGTTRPGQDTGGQWWFDFRTITWYWRPSLGDYGYNIPRPINDCLHEIGKADMERESHK